MEEIFVTHMQPSPSCFLGRPVGIDGIHRLQQRFPGSGAGELPVGLFALILILNPGNRVDLR